MCVTDHILNQQLPTERNKSRLSIGQVAQSLHKIVLLMVIYHSVKPSAVISCELYKQWDVLHHAEPGVCTRPWETPTLRTDFHWQLPALPVSQKDLNLFNMCFIDIVLWQEFLKLEQHAVQSQIAFKCLGASHLFVYPPYLSSSKSRSKSDLKRSILQATILTSINFMLNFLFI